MIRVAHVHTGEGETIATSRLRQLVLMLDDVARLTTSMVITSHRSSVWSDFVRIFSDLQKSAKV